LEQQEQQTHQIEYAAAEYYPPYHRMRPSEWTIGECQDRYDEEEENDAQYTRPHVVFHICGIPEKNVFRCNNILYSNDTTKFCVTFEFHLYKFSC